MREITGKIDRTAKKAEKNVKEFQRRLSQIPGAPPVIERPDYKKYSQWAYTPESPPELILKQFKMPDILKYDRTTNLQDHITAYSMTVKGNDLQEKEI